MTPIQPIPAAAVPVVAQGVVFVVDTREKRPYDWAGKTVKCKLQAGDYSIAGLEHCIAIERKTLADFIQTVIRSRKRFAAELKQLAGYRAACVVVEASRDDVTERRYSGCAAPGSILGLAGWIESKFGVPVVWANDRQHAKLFTEQFLIEAARRIAAG